MIRHKRRRKKIRHKPEPRIRVVPSAAIENRITQEVKKADEILRALAPARLLESAYLVSAICYHDGLFDGFNAERKEADPADRIVAQIAQRFAARTKTEFVQCLRAECAWNFSELNTPGIAVPLAYEYAGVGQSAHQFAIDLFADEGTRARSATRGLVILAENGWSSGDWFSTSSIRGGNTVIVFDPDGSRFLRYAHFERTLVSAGSFVEAGEEIGIVGHTGFNASRPGHGRHLHFEINFFDRGRTSPMTNDELAALLEAASAKSPQFAPSADPQTARE